MNPRRTEMHINHTGTHTHTHTHTHTQSLFCSMKSINFSGIQSMTGSVGISSPYMGTASSESSLHRRIVLNTFEYY